MSATSLDLLSLRAKQRLASGAAAATAQQSVPAEAATDEAECPAFGYLRGIRDRALSLEFRLASGNSRAFPYNWLGPTLYDPSAGLLLTFVGDRIYLVLLEGSNLNLLVGGVTNLFDRGILRHRITWVREMTRQALAKAREEEVTVERIRMVSHRPDEEPNAEWLAPFRLRD